MSLRDRLVLTLTLVAIVLSVPALHALQRLGAIQQLVYELRERHAEAEMAASRLESRLDDFEDAVRSSLATGDSASRSGARGALRLAALEVRRLEGAGYGEAAAPVARALDGLRDHGRILEALVEGGELDAGTDFFFERVRPRVARVRSELDGVTGEVDRKSAGTVFRAAEMGGSASRTVLWALLACLGIAGAIGVLLTRSLVGPLERLRGAMARVARGDFRVPGTLTDDRKDELGELHRSFRSMTEHLDELERVRGELVDVVTHDLKNPIHVAAGHTDLLQDGAYGDLAPGQLRATRTIREQLDLLLEQVNQLLELSRYESGRQRLDLGAVHLAELAGDLRESFGAPARRQELDFRVETAPGLPEAIRADGERLQRDLLGNLLTNAFDFTPPGGTVRVRIDGDETWVHIRVEDEGTGIPEEDLPRIFEKYYQASNRAGDGSGLGLAIARRVTEMHGGTIQVRSELGEGTTFRISLPVAGPREEAAPPVPEDADEGGVPAAPAPAPAPAETGAAAGAGAYTATV